MERNDRARENIRAKHATGGCIPEWALTVVGHRDGHAFSDTHRGSPPSLLHMP
jgi:hypothetical protein